MAACFLALQGTSQMGLRVSSSWHSSSSQTCPRRGGQAASTPGSQGAPRLGSEGVGCRAPVQSLWECGMAPEEGTQRHLLRAPNSPRQGSQWNFLQPGPGALLPLPSRLFQERASLSLNPHCLPSLFSVAPLCARTSPRIWSKRLAHSCNPLMPTCTLSAHPLTSTHTNTPVHILSHPRAHTHARAHTDSCPHLSILSFRDGFRFLHCPASCQSLNPANPLKRLAKVGRPPPHLQSHRKTVKLLFSVPVPRTSPASPCLEDLSAPPLRLCFLSPSWASGLPRVSLGSPPCWASSPGVSQLPLPGRATFPSTPGPSHCPGNTRAHPAHPISQGLPSIPALDHPVSSTWSPCSPPAPPQPEGATPNPTLGTSCSIDPFRSFSLFTEGQPCIARDVPVVQCDGCMTAGLRWSPPFHCPLQQPPAPVPSPSLSLHAVYRTLGCTHLLLLLAHLIPTSVSPLGLSFRTLILGLQGRAAHSLSYLLRERANQNTGS